MASRVGLVYDERMCAHENVDSDDHPEQPARITSIYQRLKAEGVVDRCVVVPEAFTSLVQFWFTDDLFILFCLFCLVFGLRSRLLYSAELSR